MRNLVEREDLAQKICKRCKAVFCGRLCETEKCMADIVYSAPTVTDEKSDKWIPIDKKLPEVTGAYIVSGHFGDGVTRVGECEYQTELGRFRANMLFTVDAWKPMPAPFDYKNSK